MKTRRHTKGGREQGQGCPVLPLGSREAKNPGGMWQLCKEFLLFLRQEKKWWLIPLVILLLVVGALLIFSS